MTHGYWNVLGDERITSPMFQTGDATLDVILTDWFFGTDDNAAYIVGAGGIASAETFGSPALSVSVAGAGAIPSAEVFGQPSVKATIGGAGAIPTAEALGQPGVAAGIGSAGIPSAEALGQPAIGVGMSAAGVPSGEALGQPALAARIAAAGIPSEEAVGTPSLGWAGADHEITGAGGIASVEAFGAPTIAAVDDAWIIIPMPATDSVAPEKKKVAAAPELALVVGVGGIPSGEAFGLPTITLGRNPRGFKDERDILEILKAVA
jgi:hypothetical protein